MDSLIGSFFRTTTGSLAEFRFRTGFMSLPGVQYEKHYRRSFKT